MAHLTPTDNVNDIFFYLIENYPAIGQCPNARTLAHRLAIEGFDEPEVRMAVAWIETLRQPLALQVVHTMQAQHQRIYHLSEQIHLGRTAIHSLTQLEHDEVITAEQRERIIERCMMLPVVPSQTEAFRTLVLTILWAENSNLDNALTHSMMQDFDDGLRH